MFDRSVIDKIAHRPWPMPARPWVMTQTWHDLLFAHWPVDAELLRRQVPRSFELDLYRDVAWVAVVPFRMSNVGPRGVPSLPWLSAFPELNVRTYVRVRDRPGVYFFSLDAGNAIAVKVARALLNLPYYHAAMSVVSSEERVEYRSGRIREPDKVFEATYGPIGPAALPQAGTLEHFLTERYCLYHETRAGRPYRLEIHHPAWELQPASANVIANTMALGVGVSQEAPALLHFVRRQDVIAWPPTAL